jgi:hypothetical protein
MIPAHRIFGLWGRMPIEAGGISAPIGNADQTRCVNNLKILYFTDCFSRLIWLYLAETEMHKIKDDGKIKKTVIDLHNP